MHFDLFVKKESWYVQTFKRRNPPIIRSEKEGVRRRIILVSQIIRKINRSNTH